MFVVVENNEILGQFVSQKEAEIEASWIAHLSGLNPVVIPEWKLDTCPQ